jgi:hypothetical protein
LTLFGLAFPQPNAVLSTEVSPYDNPALRP